MANSYIPTNVRVEDVLSGTIFVDWDMSSVMEKNTQARYTIWGSNDDGGTWDAIAENVIRSEGTIENDWNWIAVTSIHPTLGESVKSVPLKLIASTSTADVNQRSAVGIDEDGHFHYLKVSTDGGLILGEGIDISVDTTGLSTEDKQDVLLLNVAKESKQDTLIADLGTFNVDTNTRLDTLNTTVTTKQDEVIAAVNTANTDIAASVDAASALGAKEGKQDVVIARVETLNTTVTTKQDEVISAVNTANTDIVNIVNSKQNQVMGAIDTSRIAITTAVAAVDSSIDDFKADNTAALVDVKDSVDALAAESNTDLDAIQVQLADILAESQSINNNVQTGFKTLLRGETELTNVTPAGVKFTLPWSEKSVVNQVTAIIEGGSATDFTLEVWNKNPSTSERNVVLRGHLHESFSTTRLDFTHVVSYINLDGNDEIIVKITPNIGTSNNFFVSINGEKAH